MATSRLLWLEALRKIVLEKNGERNVLFSVHETL